MMASCGGLVQDEGHALVHGPFCVQSLGEGAAAVIRALTSRPCTHGSCALHSDLGLVLEAGEAWWRAKRGTSFESGWAMGNAASQTEPPSAEERILRSRGWRDSFLVGLVDRTTVKRPPLEELQSTLDDLSQGLCETRLHADPLRLESSSIRKAQVLGGPRMRRLHSLMTEMSSRREAEAEQHNPDDQAMLAYHGEVMKILVDGLGEIAARVPDFLPKLVWAVTWLVLPLLLHSKDSEEEKESVAVSWTLLYCLWPDGCGNTRIALDVFRRFALIECGHHGQAVAGYQARDEFFKDGFQECELWETLAGRYAQFNRHDRAAECIGEALKCAKSASKSHPQVWPYVNLHLLSRHCKHLNDGDWSVEATEAEAAFFREARRADLRMRFKDSSPPELSDLDKRKLEILATQVWMMQKTGRNLRDLREPVPELPGDTRIDIGDEMKYLSLRGTQLLVLKRFEEGMKTLHRVLALIPLALAAGEENNWRARCQDDICRITMTQALQEQCAVDGIDRSEEIRAITSNFLGLGPRIVGSSDTDDLVVDMRRFLSACETLNGELVTMDSTTYWAAWQNFSVSIQRFAETAAMLLRKNGVAAEDAVGAEYSAAFVLRHSCYAQHIHQLARIWPPPAQDCISAAELTLEAYVDQLSRQALLYAERARPCSVLLQASQPQLVQAASGSDKQALEEDLEWEMIRESQRACGANTLFVAYVGWLKPLIIWLVDSDGSISHVRLNFRQPREPTVMEECFKDVVFTMSQLPHVPGKTDDRRKLTESELTACLEFWYDCLVLPLQNKYPLFPHHKVVIVATGRFASVPFHILRNRQSGKYLFQEVTLSVVPSFRLLHQCLKRYEELQTWPLFGPGPGAAVAVGNPIYQPPTRQLPGSQEEVIAICQLFNTPLANPGYQVHKLLQEEATVPGFLDWTATKPCAVEPHSQAFIHIAAHARVDEIYPRGTLLLTATGRGRGSKVQNSAAGPGPSASTSAQPSFKFARSSLLPEATMSRLRAVVEEDAEFVRAPAALDESAGLLPSHWILSSGNRWSAYMVVLSACNSANGQVEEYGTLNLGRAFLFRGIPCSVVSQWPVPDDITVHLMTRFYKEMRQGQDASSALRSAMVSMLDDGYKLHQLAAFVVNGLPTVCLPQQLRAAA